jgi:hypothetical protein
VTGPGARVPRRRGSLGMRQSVVVVGACALALALASGGIAAPVKDKLGRKVNTKSKAVVVTRDGDALCFDQALKFGSIVIAGGRCYTFYIVHGLDGTFLGLGPAGPPLIPPGQLLKLNTPEGSKQKGRLFYSIPVPAEYVALPLGSMRYVSVNFSVQSATSTVVLRVPRTGGVTGREFELPLVR